MPILKNTFLLICLAGIAIPRLLAQHNGIDVQNEGHSKAVSLLQQGYGLLSENKHAEAIHAFEESLNGLDTLYNHLPCNKAAIYLEVSRSFADQGHIELATGYGADALELLSKDMDDCKVTGDAYLLMGNIYRYQKLNSLALEQYASAAKFFAENPEPAFDHNRITSLILAGHTSVQSQNYQLAIRFYEEVIGHLREIEQEPYNYNIAVLYQNIGTSYLELDSAENALPFFEKALRITETVYTQESEEYVLALRDLSYAHFKKGDFEVSWDMSKNVVLFYQDLGRSYHQDIVDYLLFLAKEHTQIKAHSLTAYWLERYLSEKYPFTDQNLTYEEVKEFVEIGDYFMEEGYLQQAIYFYGKAIEYSWNDRAVPYIDKDLGTLAHKIADTYYSLAKYDSAVHFYKKSLSLYPDFLKDGIATCLLNIAEIYSLKKQYMSAIEFYDRALAIVDDKHSHIRATIYQNIAVHNYELGNYKAALQHARRLYHLYQNKFTDHIHLDDCYILLGNIYTALGETENALHFYNKANFDVLAHRVNIVTLHANRHLSDIFNRKGLHDKAEKHAINAERIEQQLFGKQDN